MSHDRGCFKCNRDQWEYKNCNDPDCVKRIVEKPVIQPTTKPLTVTKLRPEWSTKPLKHKCSATRLQRHRGDPPGKLAQCTRGAMYRINGKLLCTTHAGLVVLQKLEKQ